MLGVERKREKKLSPPVISYDSPAGSRRKREPLTIRQNVSVEPARTPHRGDDDDNDGKRSRHRPERYDVVEVTPASSRYETGEPVQLPDRTKRGSLYESDMRRPRREYRIEERMPEKREKREKSQKREWKEGEREKEREARRERRRREREWR
jgi:hypothetical protein